jgi:hypothetical protein
MSRKHLGENSMSKKARANMARKLGAAMKRAGTRVGRKPIASDSLPNYENYRQVMRGMGMGLKRIDPRKVANRRHP